MNSHKDNERGLSERFWEILYECRYKFEYKREADYLFDFIESEIAKAREEDRKALYQPIMKIVRDARATFFVNEKNKDTEIPTEEIIYELRAEIADNIGMLLLTPSNQ